MTLSAAEQYAIELINRARLDPAAEALRYGVALNAGLSAGTISNDALYVLAPNTELEKIRIVLDGLRGEDNIAEPCRRVGISQSIYYKWSKDFMEAGKKRLAGDTARAANTDEVKDLRREARDLKEVVAEQTLELRLLKKSMTGDGGDHE